MRVPVIVALGVVALAVAGFFVLRPSSSAPTPVATRNVAPAAPKPAAPVPETRAAETAAARRVTPKPAPAAPVASAPVPVAAPTVGTLLIETDVADATVFVDRVGLGTAPLTVPNLAPGAHRINVSAAGFDSYAETIDIEPGARTLSIKFKEVRLDVKIDAVHKHAMGSCKGVLKASPQELAYTATDGKDNVSVAMADIDTFEVDYLAKNLRIKTRQGRTLNFTDPAGNADHLFVFHRDVDKARKRLASK